MDYKDMKFDGEVKVVDTVKRLKLTNEKGEILGAAIFDPSDAKVVQKITEIYNILIEGMKKEKETNIDVSKLKTNPESVKDFEEMGAIFTAISSNFESLADMTETIKIKVDEVFGVGTANVVTNGGTNIYAILPTIEVAMTFIEKANKANIDPYLKKTNGGVLN